MRLLRVGKIPGVVGAKKHHHQFDAGVVAQLLFDGGRPVEKLRVGQAGALAAEVDGIDAVFAAQAALQVRGDAVHHGIAGKKHFVAGRQAHFIRCGGRGFKRFYRC